LAIAAPAGCQPARSLPSCPTKAQLQAVAVLERGRAIGVDLPDVRTLPWLTIQAPEGLDKVPTAADLGAGEKEVLALGTQVPCDNSTPSP
jgi:hypothetical protein